jgi:hypothetical protein
MTRIIIAAAIAATLSSAAQAQVIYREPAPIQPYQPIQPILPEQQFQYWNPSRGGPVDGYGNATSPPGVGLNGQPVRPRAGSIFGR